MNAPKVVKMKTQVFTRPQSDERIEAISKAKATGQSFHVTGGGHINSDDYFKSRVLLEMMARIKELEADKVRIQESIMLQIGKDNVMRAKCPLTQETKCNFLVVEIKLLLTLKLIKNVVVNKAVLLDQCFEAPEPAPIISWSTTQEQELSRLKVSSIKMKETDVAISVAQMARSIRKNINLLTTPENTRLKESINEKMV